MAKGKATFIDRDRGFKKLAASLGDMGSITLGIQGKEALEKHPESDMTVGQIAAIHELGLTGIKRSWLVSWMDDNAGRMLKESSSALSMVMKGQVTRNAALIKLGYAWCADIREVMSSGKITPALSPGNPRGAGAPPLFDTHTLHNSVTYKVFLPQVKSIRNTGQRAAARFKK